MSIALSGFLVLGSFLGLAQPRRFFIVCTVIILGAVFLEYSQSFMRGRHGVLHDFEFKVIGGLLGAGMARALTGTIRIFLTARRDLLTGPAAGNELQKILAFLVTLCSSNPSSRRAAAGQRTAIHPKVDRNPANDRPWRPLFGQS